jgi:hypothetical protein
MLSYCADKEEALKGEVTSSSNTASQWQNWDVISELLVFPGLGPQQST